MDMGYTKESRLGSSENSVYHTVGNKRELRKQTPRVRFWCLITHQPESNRVQIIGDKCGEYSWHARASQVLMLSLEFNIRWWVRQ